MRVYRQIDRQTSEQTDTQTH